VTRNRITPENHPQHLLGSAVSDAVVDCGALENVGLGCVELKSVTSHPHTYGYLTVTVTVHRDSPVVDPVITTYNLPRSYRGLQGGPKK